MYIVRRSYISLPPVNEIPLFDLKQMTPTNVYRMSGAKILDFYALINQKQPKRRSPMAR